MIFNIYIIDSHIIISIAIAHPASTGLLEFLIVRRVDLISGEYRVHCGGRWLLLCQLANTLNLLGIRKPILLIG